MLDYKLIRSPRRKTLALQVKHGKITVRAPVYLCEQQISAFIMQKSSWLKLKIKQQNQQANVVKNQFSHNDTIWFLGEQKNLKITFQNSSQIINLNDELSVALASRYRKLIDDEAKLASKVKQQLEQWLKEQATQYITSKLSELSTHCQLYPTSFIIKRYKARWGSCNSRGCLSFNYLLMMTPTWVIDYVIVHELCHLKHLNHSPKFWQLVAKYSPNYQQAKEWLKSHQTHLQWQLPNNNL